MIKNSIKLDRVTFFGYHGVNDDEIKNGQNFVLDLSVGYQLSDNIDDNLGSTIDYIDLYNLVQNSFESKRFNLLESLGQKILSDIIKQYDSVYHITLNIRKPSIIMDKNKDFINVEVEYTK